MKGRETTEVYQHKREILGELENLSNTELIDLYYADESRVNLEPCVPYSWQFADEEVSMPSSKGKAINCFALVSRNNRSWMATSEQAIGGEFVMEQFEHFSFSIRQITVVVLDNAPIHHCKQMRERTRAWQRRGLFIFYLPTYSPHLNISETLWRKLKYEWLAPEDYSCREQLKYSVKQALSAFGKSLRIKFAEFKSI